MDFQPFLHRSTHVLGLLASTVLAGSLTAGLLPLTPAASAAQADDRRRIVGYTVRPGDTATELAVRFHAWTDELIRLNRLGSDAALYVGERIRIPVVVSRTHRSTPTPHRPTGQHSSHNWRDPSRAAMRRLIIETAHRYGVDDNLALAISWQEAGWQMHHTSSAGAIGAMQVMPDTGVWMSLYAGRRLNLRVPYDNVLAGVLLIRVLRGMTHSQKAQIAAYYQGIGAVQRGVMYDDTRHYVANVKAIKRLLQRGWNPAD